MGKRHGSGADSRNREGRGTCRTVQPLLVLYPEISSERRKIRADCRRTGQAPLVEDYHPHDTRLLLDHARIPGRAALHDGDRLVEELDRNPSTDRIDLIQGMGHGDRQKFWREYYRVVNNEGDNEHEPYPYCTYVHFVYGNNLGGSSNASDGEPPYASLIAIQY